VGIFQDDGQGSGNLRYRPTDSRAGPALYSLLGKTGLGPAYDTREDKKPPFQLRELPCSPLMGVA